MIKLTKSDFEKILAHAVKELPDEACGLIAGTVEGGDKEIKKVYLLTNIDHSNEHFSLDPKEQLEAIKDMRKNGFVLSATGIHIPNHRQDRLKRTKDLPLTARQAI